jgi:hypothetical protein
VVSVADWTGQFKTYATGEAFEILGAPSERWLVEQLRVGRFSGRKVGRLSTAVEN